MAKPVILVVENNGEHRASWKDLLEANGYEVLEAGKPKEAHEKVQSRLVHLALVDLRTVDDADENDKSGIDFCQKLDHVVARILITQYSTWPIVRQALLKGPGDRCIADSYLDKINDSPQMKLDEIQRVLKDRYEIFPQSRFAVLTSGGDSPGMNAAIRAVVRESLCRQVEVIGVMDGYRGLCEDRIRILRWNDVTDIAEISGTILGAARYEEFKSDPRTRTKAVQNMMRHHISGLICIGGDGSMRGAKELADEMRSQGGELKTVAIPGTIDNDLWGTDYSLGCDSAANGMIQELRHMIAPAQALRRIFVVEVMGAACGYLALQAAMGIGADAVLIPETILQADDPAGASRQSLKNRSRLVETKSIFSENLDKISERLQGAFLAGKKYGFVIIAEAFRLHTEYKSWTADAVLHLQDRVKKWPKEIKPDVRQQELGYPVRGIPPNRFDVWLGSTFGCAAVEALIGGENEVMLGWTEKNGLTKIPYDQVVSSSRETPAEKFKKRPDWKDQLDLIERLAEPPPSSLGEIRPQFAPLDRTGRSGSQ